MIKAGGSGRMGTWAYSYGFTNTLALGEYAKSCIEKDVTPKNFRRNFKMDALLKTFDAETPGASWNGTIYKDASTGLELKNNILVYQDTYIFGKGYLNMTGEVIPEKYLDMK